MFELVERGYATFSYLCSLFLCSTHMNCARQPSLPLLRHNGKSENVQRRHFCGFRMIVRIRVTCQGHRVAIAKVRAENESLKLALSD